MGAVQDRRPFIPGEWPMRSQVRGNDFIKLAARDAGHAADAAAVPGVEDFKTVGRLSGDARQIGWKFEIQRIVQGSGSRFHGNTLPDSGSGEGDASSREASGRAGLTSFS